MQRRKSNAAAGSPTRLKGSLVAIATPFRAGQLDEVALARLCDRQVRSGSAAQVVCGSTGEAPALTPAEQARVVSVAVAAVAGRAPVVAGCGAALRGAGAVLCAPPPYIKPTQEGIYAHVRAVAHAAGLPVMLYDVPGRVGVAVSDDTVARLFEGGLIAAVKDAAGDLSRPVRLRALCGEGLVQLAGDDATAAAHHAMGGHGCVSVTANLAPALCAQLHAAWDRGDLAAVARLRDLLAPLHQALFLESNPIPLKAALGMLDLCSGDLRLPLTNATPTTCDNLVDLLPGLMQAEAEAAMKPRLMVVR